MNVGQQLKKARNEAGLTQESLADKIGVSRQSISSWENSRSYPDIINLIALSDLYSLSLDSLIKGDEKMIKNLEEKTDVTKSNRQLAIMFIVWSIIYLGIYLLKSTDSIPTINDFVLNISVIILVVVIMLFQLVRHIKITGFLEKNTSNRVILKWGIAIGFVAAVFIIFPILDMLFVNETIIWMTRFGVITLLTIITYALQKRVSK